MADRVLLHLGTPKSGTTWLQQLLWNNRSALARAGVGFPGWRPEAHFLACQDLLGVEFNDWPDPGVAGAWRRLVDQVRAVRGTAVVSHELFGDAPADVAARALADLAPAEVHLVVTARDLARQLPAVWQEDVKNRHTTSYPDFLDAAGPRPGAPGWSGAAFWHRQDVPAVLRRWAGSAVPPERVHVVVVPPRGASLDVLWHRFAGVLGAPAELVDLPAASAVNRSLGVAESELLRRLNGRLEGRVPWPLHAERITHHLAPVVLAPRAGRPLTLPPADHRWVSARSRAMTAELAAAGYDVAGDLTELVVPPLPPAAAVDDRAPDDAELLDAALDALAGLVATRPDPAPPLPRRIARRLARLVDR